MAELEPAYLVLGTDRPKVSTVIARLKSHFDDDAVEQHAAIATPAAEIVAGCMMMGLLAARRLVVITGVDAWKADDVAAMVAYLKDPSPDTVLLLTADKLAANSRLKKAFAKPRLIECAGPTGEAGIARWVTGRFREHGVTVDQRTAVALVRACGEDSVDRLETDVARIAAYAGSDIPVDTQLIAQLATHHSEEKVWGLTDAWASRDRRTLLAITEQLLAQREHPARLVAVIARHLRYVHMARRLLDQQPASQVVATLGHAGLQSWPARKAVEQAQRISLPQADAALARVTMLEAELKGGSNLSGHIAGGRDAQTVVFERGLLELV